MLHNEPSAGGPGAGHARRWAVWAAVALAAAAGGAVVLRWRTTPPTPVAWSAPADDLPDAAAPENPGYLGPRACAPCHAARVAEFQKTNHFRACREPREGDMPLGFEPGRGAYAPPGRGVGFTMTHAGEDFLVTAVPRTAVGGPRATSRIAFVYGAAAADEVFFTWHGDGLYELPVVWLHPQSAWGNTPFSPHGTGEPDFSRHTTPRCLECHNTWFGHVPGSANRYRTDHYLLGVTCERCHGPGNEHVAYHEAHPDADAGHAVVHPGRLSRERRLEVCTQCHSNADKGRGEPFRYRPGERLEDYYRTARGKHPEDEHVANQVTYLRGSKCFQKSDTLTCTTCHDPHRPPDTAAVRGACAQCHKPADCAARPRLPGAVRDDCAGCHMPRRVWMNVHFDTADDSFVPPTTRHEHRIAVYPEAEWDVLRGWQAARPNGEGRAEAAALARKQVDFWLAEAGRRRREYRFLAAIGAYREALRVDPTPEVRAGLREAAAAQSGVVADMTEGVYLMGERRFPEAIAALNKVLAVKPDHALAHGRLGTLYAATGNRDLATEHLRAVSKYDPNDAYGDNMLGWLAFLEGRPAEAAEDFRRAAKAEPYSADLNYREGLALARLGQTAEAVGRFRQAVAIDPNHAGGSQGLSDALRRQGESEEALRYARRAVRLTRSENADVLLTLAEACAAAGRAAEADAAAEKALDAARKGDPRQLPAVRERVGELRARGGRTPG